MILSKTKICCPSRFFSKPSNLYLKHLFRETYYFQII